MSSAACKVLIVCLICFVSVHARNAPEWQQTPPRISGFVLCDSCLEKTFTFNTIGIPNVTVTIECAGFQATTTTSRFGLFKFDIPTGISVNISTCSVAVKDDFSRVQSQLKTCSSPVAEFTVKHSPPLSSPSSLPKLVQEGFPLYHVGPFVFQPAEALTVCKNRPPFPFQRGTGKSPPAPSSPCPPSRNPTSSPSSKSVSAATPGTSMMP